MLNFLPYYVSVCVREWLYVCVCVCLTKGMRQRQLRVIFGEKQHSRVSATRWPSCSCSGIASQCSQFINNYLDPHTDPNIIICLDFSRNRLSRDTARAAGRQIELKFNERKVKKEIAFERFWIFERKQNAAVLRVLLEHIAHTTRRARG